MITPARAGPAIIPMVERMPFSAAAAASSSRSTRRGSSADSDDSVSLRCGVRDRARALAVLRRAIELGVDHIDTSQYYGPDVVNELIRETLHPYPADLKLVTVQLARIKAASVATGSPRRDANMHRKVLESPTFPEIVFQAGTYKGDLGKLSPGRSFTTEIAGELTIHGPATSSCPFTVSVPLTFTGTLIVFDEAVSRSRKLVLSPTFPM